MKVGITSVSYEEPPEPFLIGKKDKSYVRWYKSRKQFEQLSSKGKISNADRPQYIEQMIKMVDAEQTKKTPRDCDETLNALYRFTICLQCPKLFLKKQIPAHKETEQSNGCNKYGQTEDKREAMAQEKEKRLKKQQHWLSEYHSIQSKFTEKLRNGMHRYMLCQTYIRRGTTELDRDYVAPSDPKNPGEGRNLPLEILEKLRQDIQQYYLYYYKRLDSLGYQVKEKPKVSERLLEHCCEKPWLITIAHIFLLRDAQYQMMGDHKYTATTILQEDSKPFLLSRKQGDCVKEESEVDPVVSHEIAKRIQAVFAYYMSLYANTTLTAGILNRVETGLSITALLGASFFEGIAQGQRAFEIVNDWSEILFAVPDCKPDVLALKIGKAQALSTVQVDALQKWISMILWQDCNIKKLFENDPELRHTDVDAMNEILRSIKEFLNPERYYSYKTGKGGLRQSLIRASKILGKYRIVKSSSKDGRKQTEETMASFITARDISNDILYISGAVAPYKEKMYPPFVQYYKQKLEKKLDYYQRKSIILSSMGYKNSDLGENYDRYLKAYSAYTQAIQETKKLTWTEAKEILRDLLCSGQSPEKRKEKIKTYLQKRYKADIAYPSSDAPGQVEALVYYVQYSCLVKTALHMLKNRSVNIIEKLYMQYLREKYQSERNQWLIIKKAVVSQGVDTQAERSKKTDPAESV